jgi:hypothetical protein
MHGKAFQAARAASVGVTKLSHTHTTIRRGRHAGKVATHAVTLGPRQRSWHHTPAAAHRAAAKFRRQIIKAKW